MKKRNKFLLSLLGVVSLCGAFVGGLLVNRKDNVKTEAVSYQSLQEFSSNHNNEVYGSAHRIIYSYTLYYQRVYDNDYIGYNFRLDFTFTLRLWTQQGIVLLHKNDSSTFSYMTYSSQSNYFDSHILNGTTVSLYLTEVSIAPLIGRAYGVLKTEFRWGLNVLEGVVAVSGYPYYDNGVKDTNTNDITSFNVSNIDLNLGSQLINFTDNAYDDGYADGYDAGYNDGLYTGVNQGYNDGYQSGYNQAYNELQQQITNSYTDGYNTGYSDGLDSNGTAITIMTGIFQVALVPINFFLGMFNFDILGINLANVVQALFTIAVTIILIKVVTGKKGE